MFSTETLKQHPFGMVMTAVDVTLKKFTFDGAASAAAAGVAIALDVSIGSPSRASATLIAAGAVTKELLDGCDIKMTMYHNRQCLLARSNKGVGTLSYEVDEKGVKFTFDAPNTQHGDEALELIRRGDISGCSFMFTTRYYDDACVSRTATVVNGVTMITYTVKAVTGVYDFTITDNPAYPDTSVEAREFVDGLKEPEQPKPEPKDDTKMREQLREMRCAARCSII